MNHQEDSIGECYISLKWQADWYDQEIRALWFFEPDHNTDLACQVLAIADWAGEFNGMSTHPILDIPPALESEGVKVFARRIANMQKVLGVHVCCCACVYGESLLTSGERGIQKTTNSFCFGTIRLDALLQQ